MPKRLFLGRIPDSDSVIPDLVSAEVPDLSYTSVEIQYIRFGGKPLV
jgi:hypothetical protein